MAKGLFTIECVDVSRPVRGGRVTGWQMDGRKQHQLSTVFGQLPAVLYKLPPLHQLPATHWTRLAPDAPSHARLPNDPQP